MAGKSEKLEIQDGLFTMLQGKLRDEGWDSVRHFTMSNQRSLGLSLETTRRVFIPCEYKSLEPYTIVNVMMHLNFSRVEIREALKTFTNDKLMWKLIGGDDDKATVKPHELAILEMLRSVADKNPEIYTTIGNMIQTMGTAYGVDLSDSMRRIAKGTQRKRAAKE